MTTRLIIRHNGVDVSDDCHFEIGQGYGVHRIVHYMREAGIEEPFTVGSVKFGDVIVWSEAKAAGYTHEIVEEPS